MKQSEQERALPVEQVGLSRRNLLKLAAVGTLGVAVGAGAAAGGVGGAVEE